MIIDHPDVNYVKYTVRIPRLNNDVASHQSLIPGTPNFMKGSK